MVRNMSSQIIGMTFFWDLLRRDKNNQIFKSATNEVRASSTDDFRHSKASMNYGNKLF